MKNKSTPWTKSHIDYLKEYYYKQDIEQTSFALGRTSQSVRAKASQIFKGTNQIKVKKEPKRCICCNSQHSLAGEHCQYCVDCLNLLRGIKEIVSDILKQVNKNGGNK